MICRGRKGKSVPRVRGQTLFGEWLPLLVIAAVFVVFSILGGGSGGG